MPWLVAAISGVLLAIPFLPTGVSGSEFVGILLLLCVLPDTTWGKSFLLGFAHGIFFYGITLFWVFTVIRVHGQANVFEAGGVLALMVLKLSFFPAIFACLVSWIRKRKLMLAYVAAPFLWTALEFARGHMPVIAFPWNQLGYAASNDLFVLQLASVTGIYGLTFLIVAFNAWLASFVARDEVGLLKAFGFYIIFLFVYILGGNYAEKFVPFEGASRTAHLVQTNLPQSANYGADWWERHSKDMDELERISIEAGKKSPGLIIWPEEPAPFTPADQRFSQRTDRIAKESGSHLLVGVVEYRPDMTAPKPGPAETRLWLPTVAYNSAVLLSPEGKREFTYDKIHLVAFGEYVPFRSWLTFAGKIVAEISDFHPGTEYRIGKLPDGHKFGTFICFEAIFPEEVRQFTAGGAELLINLSNDGWFGRSAAPDQHLRMARVRAVENRRWLLRATNNGYTVSVDPYGRIVSQLAPDVRGVLHAPYEFRSDQTIYARLGDWFAWMCVIVSAGIFVWSWRRTN
ncbi:MAG: apolipoprotein N-acyltransferase [Acidobacteria bacterium]|nr:apolipoprotein N-acyltransferase [Acidobacteriota bacterium]